MDDKRYDEYGRPIRKKSFFDNFSKPKKREYEYKREEKTLDRKISESKYRQETINDNEIDQVLNHHLNDYENVIIDDNLEYEIPERTKKNDDENFEDSSEELQEGMEDEVVDKIPLNEVKEFLDQNKVFLFFKMMFFGSFLRNSLDDTIKRIERDYEDFTSQEQNKLNIIKYISNFSVVSFIILIFIYFYFSR